MTVARGRRRLHKRPESESDAEWVPKAETVTVRTEKGQSASTPSSDGRGSIELLDSKAISSAPEENSEQANESLGEKQEQSSAKLPKKKSRQVSETTEPEPKRLKGDAEFKKHMQGIDNWHSRLVRKLHHSADRVMDLELSAKDKQTEVKALKKENSELSNHVDNLRVEVARLKNSNESIQGDYTKLKENHEEIKRHAIQALEDAQMHHPDKLPSISVDTINKEWRRLIYDVHDFVVQHLTALPVDDDKTKYEPAMERVIEWVKDASELRVPLLERCIWKLLQCAVFQDDSEIWGGDIEIPFVENFNNLKVQRKVSVMRAMKSRAAEIIISKFGADESLKLLYMQGLGKCLAPFTESPVSTKFQEGLALLFNSAIKIMKMFIRSQDIYEFGPCFEQFPGEKIVYDKEIMKISSFSMVPGDRNIDQPQRFAFLVVHNPPLFVTSTTEGEHFGLKELVCHAFVTVCGEEVADDDTTKEQDQPMDEISVEANSIVS